MPCMNFTSDAVQCGDAPVVDAGNFLVGCPGAPGCTTTGAGALVCCASVEGASNPDMRIETASTAQNVARVVTGARNLEY
ncbi:MAG: hypothetical protein WA823_05280 [Candidatus Acidiferrales bacterium]